MADNLNMAGISLNDGKQPNGMPRSAYIPPHLRGQGRGGQSPMGMDGAEGAPRDNNPGLGASAWGPAP